MTARDDILLGEVRDMPAADYFAVDAVSNSALKEFARSPWHYRNRVEKEPTRRMFRGTLAHCAALESDAMAARYIVTPEDAPRRPTAAQWNAKKPSPDSASAMAWWTDFNARAAGREIVSADEYAVTKAQLAAVLAVPELAALLADCYTETSVFWIDDATGLYCKARPDVVHTLPDGRVILADLKTTADEAPDAFARTVWNFGYYRQAAHYSKGYMAATGRDVAAFVFAAVSSAPPVLAVPYMLDDDAMQRGRESCADLLRRLAECRATSEWTAYGSGVQVLSLPAWAK